MIHFVQLPRELNREVRKSALRQKIQPTLIFPNLNPLPLECWETGSQYVDQASLQTHRNGLSSMNMYVITLILQVPILITMVLLSLQIKKKKVKQESRRLGH